MNFGLFSFSFFYIYKVGFIREKGKATAIEDQWNLEAGSCILFFLTTVNLVGKNISEYVLSFIKFQTNKY
jgi:hypothetical protein